ncbi:hypothetical protein ACWGLF_31420 [Streptomyces puniciscabiei]
MTAETDAEAAGHVGVAAQARPQPWAIEPIAPGDEEAGFVTAGRMGSRRMAHTPDAGGSRFEQGGSQIGTMNRGSGCRP